MEEFLAPMVLIVEVEVVQYALLGQSHYYSVIYLLFFSPPVVLKILSSLMTLDLLFGCPGNRAQADFRCDHGHDVTQSRGWRRAGYH